MNGSHAFATAFTSLSMILLCFFLLLTRYAALDESRSHSAVDSLRKDFIRAKTGQDIFGENRWELTTAWKTSNSSLVTEKSSLLSIEEAAQEIRGATMERSGHQLIIRIPPALVFTPRDFQIQAAQASALTKLFTNIAQSPLDVTVLLKQPRENDFEKSQQQAGVLYRLGLDTGIDSLKLRLRHSLHEELHLIVDDV